MTKQKPGCNVKTGQMVLTAIKKLMQNTGWTTRTIVKFIKMEYRVAGPAISRKISRALKRGVKLGLLQMSQGRYRLNDMSRLAQPVKPREVHLRGHTKLRQRALEIRSRSPSA